MVGVLDSGVNAILELSPAYVRASVAELFGRLDPFCYTGDLGEDPTRRQVEDFVPLLDDVWLEATGADVLVHVALAASYGSYVGLSGTSPIPPTDRFVSGRAPSGATGYEVIPPLRLTASVVDGRAALTLVWPFLPDIELESLTFGLDALSRQASVQLADGTTRDLNVFSVAVRETAVRVAGQKLQVGLRLECDQDDDLADFGNQLGPAALSWIQSTAPTDLAAFGTPNQAWPIVSTANDDWTLALELWMFRNVLAIHAEQWIPPSGVPCDPAVGQVYVSHMTVWPDLRPGGFAVNAYGLYSEGCDPQGSWHNFEADALGTVGVATSGQVGVTYAITRVSSPDDPYGGRVGRWFYPNFPQSVFAPFPILSRIDAVDFGIFEARSGRLVADGVVLSGDGSLEFLDNAQIEYRVLPETVWAPLEPVGNVPPPAIQFGKGCTRGPVQRTIELQNRGRRALRTCPAVLPEGSGFAVVQPPAMMPGGAGGRGTVRVTVEFMSDSGAVSPEDASIVFPADPYTVALSLHGDLRASEIAFPDLRVGTGGVPVDIVHADHMRPCHVTPRPTPFEFTIHIRNTGLGPLQVCGVAHVEGDSFTQWFNVTSRFPLIVASGHDAHINFRCHLSDYSTQLHTVIQLISNVPVGRLITLNVRRELLPAVADEFGILGGIGDELDELICAQIDWSKIPGRRFLPPALIGQLVERLGGNPCCPPPQSPACLCADMLEITLDDLGEDVSLTARDSHGNDIAAALPAASPSFLVPEREGIEDIRYGNAKLTQRSPSRMTVRRYSVEHVDHFESDETYEALAARGDLIFASGTTRYDIVRFSAPTRFEIVHSGRLEHHATAIAPIGDDSIVLATGEGLLVMRAGEKPVGISGPFDTLTYAASGDDRLIWASGGSRCALYRVESHGKPELCASQEFDKPIRDICTWAGGTHLLTDQGLTTIEWNRDATAIRTEPLKVTETRPTPLRLLTLAGRLAVLHSDQSVAFFRHDKDGHLRLESNWSARDWSMYLPSSARSIGTVVGIGHPQARHGQPGFSLYTLRRRKVAAAGSPQALHAAGSADQILIPQVGGQR